MTFSKKLVWQLFLSYIFITSTTVFATFLYFHSVQDPTLLHYIEAAFWILGLAIGVSLFVSFRITSPLEELQNNAKRYSKGDFSENLPIFNSLEIDELSQTMNTMATQLDERFKAILQERNEKETLLNCMTDGVISLSKEGVIQSINPAAMHFLGESPYNRVGLHIVEAIRNTELNEGVQKLLANEVTHFESILSFPHCSCVQVQGVTLQKTSQTESSFLLVLHDLSKLKQIETIRSEFISNVSHELKTPITLIQGFLETLQDPDLEQEDRDRFLAIVKTHADRLHILLEDLLQLARIEQGHHHQLNSHSLNESIEKSLSFCMTLAKKMGVTLHFSPGGSPLLPLNPTLFEQALSNLIQNALYHSQSAKIDVITECENEAVRIKVIDYGIGIEAEHLGRLFERFYRVDKSRSRQEGRTGLGLSIVKHIILAHNGRVDVQSTIGKGTTFTLVLPCPSTQQ